MLTCKVWMWVYRDVICNAFLVGECVMGNENTTEYGLVLVFLIQASTEISDVSKVAFKVLLRGLKNISDRSQIWKLEFRVL